MVNIFSTGEALNDLNNFKQINCIRNQCTEASDLVKMYKAFHHNMNRLPAIPYIECLILFPFDRKEFEEIIFGVNRS